jgi:hypothetical protein
MDCCPPTIVLPYVPECTMISRNKNLGELSFPSDLAFLHNICVMCCITRYGGRIHGCLH